MVFFFFLFSYCGLISTSKTFNEVSFKPNSAPGDLGHFGDNRVAHVELVGSWARAARRGVGMMHETGGTQADYGCKRGFFFFFLKKTPKVVKPIVLTRSHRETKRYDASITKSLFKAGINFLALVTGLNLNQLKAAKRKSSKNHRNKYEMGIYEGFSL